VILATLFVLLGITAFRFPRWRQAAPSSRTGDRRAIALAGALAAHAVAMPLIGFVPAGAALFVAATALFGSRRWPRNLAIGLATTVVLYVAFTSGLGMSLPPDPLTAWLRR
jgi:putative tricarboxylic transport membrane protein